MSYAATDMINIAAGAESRTEQYETRGGDPRRLGHSLVLSAVHLTIICVLADAPFPGMFCRGRHLKPFLRLEYVIPRDDTVHTFAQAHAYTGGGQQHAGQRRLVGQGNMDVIRRSSRAT